MTRRRLAGVVGYLGVFLLGAVTGGSVMRATDARSDATVFDDQGGNRHRMYVWSLDKKLDLTAPQRQRIEAILATHDGERDAISAPVEPRLKELRALIRGEIREVLTPEQRGEFDELMRRYDEGRGQRRAPSRSP